MNFNEKQYEVLQWAFSFLKKHNREENIADILLQHHLNVSKQEYYMMMRETIPKQIIDSFRSDVKKHALTGIPVQHIIGYEYFYGRKFDVNEHVLVPRYETEGLVEHVIHIVRRNFKDKEITIVDLGTGSGVIATTLALELENVHVFATDISKHALGIAQKNSTTNGANVSLFEGDFLQPILDMKVNPQIIVSNPPYIKHADVDSLADTVKDYDPHLALFAEDHGLAAYKKIVEQLTYLPPVQNRHICFEIGFDQAKDVTTIVEKDFPESEIIIKQDINSKDRIVSISL